ncbi:MAG TPA: helix-turn-helix domain-containing protein [Gemmatimonadaceae bacterium]|nr:helix-turn-helix domain-containing protein [Gemmatimonadaceae bacterium]
MTTRIPRRTAATAPWRHGARQQRSRRTEDALSRAALRLLRERPFEQIRVEDLTSRANVAVGTFYRRFRDKRAVLHLADMGFVNDCLAAFDAAMSDERMRSRSLEEIVTAYITVMVTKFREHRAEILQVIRHADAGDAGEYAARAQAFNTHVHGRFRELLRRHVSTMTHPSLETALNLAIFFASAAARDAVWRGNLRAYPIALDDARLIAELTRAFVAYLRS